MFEITLFWDILMKCDWMPSIWFHWMDKTLMWLVWKIKNTMWFVCIQPKRSLGCGIMYHWWWNHLCNIIAPVLWQRYCFLLRMVVNCCTTILSCCRKETSYRTEKKGSTIYIVYCYIDYHYPLSFRNDLSHPGLICLKTLGMWCLLTVLTQQY